MKFLSVVCVLCSLAFPSLALDREAFTFTNYDLNVRVEPEQQRLGVRGKITIRNDSTTPQRDIALQISSTLDWRSIHIAGKPAQFVTHEYTSDIDHTGALSEAIVTLPNEVPSQGTVELDVGYEGVIPLDVTRLTRMGVPEAKARHTDWDRISTSFTAVRGIGYVAWYPVATESASLSEGNSVARTVGRWKARELGAAMDVNFCMPGDTSTTRLGLMNERIDGGPGASAAGTSGSKAVALCTRHKYQPVGDIVPVFVDANYLGLGKASIYFHFFPAHKSAVEDYAMASELAMPLVREWFGTPRRKADLVELSDPEAAPFESGTMLLMPLSGDDTRLYELTAAHQLTHAAFFSPRSWIYEGLAHFAQALEREQQDGRQSAVDFMALHRTAIVDAERTLAAEHNQSKAADESLINTNTDEFYRSKAMYVWWMLRDMIGDAALKKALATYDPDQDKGSSYVQRLIEAQAHRDLEWFFDDWVYRDRGLPDFRVESAYPRTTVDGGYVVTVTIENLGDAAAEVPVTLRMASGEVTKRLEVHARSKASIRIDASSTPKEIVVNDGSVPESDVSNNVFEISPSDAAK
jgi:hypothetical protein